MFNAHGTKPTTVESSANVRISMPFTTHGSLSQRLVKRLHQIGYQTRQTAGAFEIEGV